MVVRDVEWKKPYTWGTAITVDPETKVISLNLRDENNLIIYDAWDDEIYVDLQLPDWIEPTDAFPVWVTTGRVLVADWWSVLGTLICAKTTSGDNIKILYSDAGQLFIDNGSWTFKQIYLKAEVDALLLGLRQSLETQINAVSNRVTSLENTQTPGFAIIEYDSTEDKFILNSNYAPLKDGTVCLVITGNSYSGLFPSSIYDENFDLLLTVSNTIPGGAYFDGEVMTGMLKYNATDEERVFFPWLWATGVPPK